MSTENAAENIQHWAIEGFDFAGKKFFYHPYVTTNEACTLLELALKNGRTGGVVISRPASPDAAKNAGSVALLAFGLGIQQEEGEPDEQGLGLVAGEPPCSFCGERGGHTADCPAVS